MKKIAAVFCIILLFIGHSSNAQVSLDTILTTNSSLAYNFKVVEISRNETKYFCADSSTNTFSLYNMDWTPFLLNVSVPLPFSNFSYQCLYITRSLFDCDSTNIEYLYTSPNGNSDRQLFVMRTDGTQLFQMDSAFCEYCYGDCLGGSDLVKPIVNSSSGAKLFILRSIPASSSLYVYSLCGTLINDVFEFSPEASSFVSIFPNPTASTLTFRINPPDNIRSYEIVILDGNGQVLDRQQLEAPFKDRTIDVSRFNSGTYYYTLCTKDKAYQSGKFVIAK